MLLPRSERGGRVRVRGPETVPYHMWVLWLVINGYLAYRVWMPAKSLMPSGERVELGSEPKVRRAPSLPIYRGLIAGSLHAHPSLTQFIRQVWSGDGVKVVLPQSRLRGDAATLAAVSDVFHSEAEQSQPTPCRPSCARQHRAPDRACEVLVPYSALRRSWCKRTADTSSLCTPSGRCRWCSCAGTGGPRAGTRRVSRPSSASPRASRGSHATPLCAPRLPACAARPPRAAGSLTARALRGGAGGCGRQPGVPGGARAVHGRGGDREPRAPCARRRAPRL
jgi:hypothetical protein